MLDAIVIGAGPAGIATAACLRRLGARVRIVDRDGAIGGAYRVMDPEIVLTSPSRLIGLPGAPTTGLDRYATAGAYFRYLEGYARAHDLVAERGVVEAVAVGRPGHVVAVRAGDRLEHVDARAIVVATGMFDAPVIPEIAGRAEVPAIHSSRWRATHATARRVVVVGGASSAIEVAEAAARRGCEVVIATHKVSMNRQTVLGVDPAYALFPILARVSPTKFCNGTVTVPGVDRGFAALQKSGAIRVVPPLTRIDGARCTFAGGRSFDTEIVVFATGYRHAVPALPADVAVTPRGLPRCVDGHAVGHPALWFVGLPCARSAASQYLYGISRDAEHVAGRIGARVKTRGCLM